jgi:serine/threonine protein kinase
MCYDPHSKFLEDHYVLGERLGKGNFGEVRKARLRLLSHEYSKRAVGANGKIVKHKQSIQSPEEAGEVPFNQDELLGSTSRPTVTINEQRRANLDRAHFWQGITDWPFACKILKKNRVDLKSISREIQVLDACQHDNVMLLVEYFDAKKTIYVVVGRCYGDAEMVHNHEKEGIPLQRVLKWTGQMASAVAYIHTMAVCHRDIKLPNLLLNSSAEDSGVVLGDFGFAEYEKYLESDDADICGTPLALSPEVFFGGYQTRTSDVWAMGITFFEMVAHEHPFSNKDVQIQVATLLREQHASQEEVIKTPPPATGPTGVPIAAKPSITVESDTQPRPSAGSNLPSPSRTSPTSGGNPHAIQRTNTKTEEKLTEFKEAAAMYKSATFKRQKTNEHSKSRTGHLKLHSTRERGDANAHVVQENGVMREPSEFYTVAARFSTNAKFVQKFEELAVAVTSEPIQPSFANPRFAESPESSQLQDLAKALLTRDPKERKTAELIAAMCYLNPNGEGDRPRSASRLSWRG